MKTLGLSTYKNKGFTLLEVLLGLALSSLVFLVLFQVFFTSSRVLEEATSVDAQMSFVLDAMVKEINEAAQLVLTKDQLGYPRGQVGFLLRAPSRQYGIRRWGEAYYYTRLGILYRHGSREDTWGGHNVIYRDQPVDFSGTQVDVERKILTLVVTSGDRSWTRQLDLSFKELVQP